MKIYRPNTPIGKYYSILFTLPHINFIIGLTALFALLLIFSMGLIGIIYIMYYLVTVASLSIYTRIGFSVLYRVKRILGLALASSIYGLLIGLLTKWDIGVLSASTIVVTALIGLDGMSIYRYIVALTPSITTIAIGYVLKLPSPRSIYAYMLGAVLIAVIDYIIYIALSKYKFRDYAATRLGTLFMWNWLEKKTDLDLVFGRYGREEVVEPRILVNDEVAVIYTDIHYGPFSNIGSSTLPRKLESMLREKYGIASIILHGMGSHERNLVSNEESNKYVEYLSSLIKHSGESQKYYGAFRIKGKGQWEILGIVFSNVSYLIISNPKIGIDDLPYELQAFIDKVAFERRLGDIILVDAHNWEKEGAMDIESLRDLLIDAVELVEKLRKERVPVEPRIKCISVHTDALGVIDGAVYGVEISGEGKESVLLIYFRGNNIAPGVRNSIVELALKNYLGATHVEVLTNDEHTETGVRAFVTYIPIQGTTKLYESVLEMLKDLASREYTTGAYLIRGRGSFRLMNDDVEELVKLLQKVYPLTTALLLSYVLLTPVLLAWLFTII